MRRSLEGDWELTTRWSFAGNGGTTSGSKTTTVAIQIGDFAGLVAFAVSHNVSSFSSPRSQLLLTYSLAGQPRDSRS